LEKTLKKATGIFQRSVTRVDVEYSEIMVIWIWNRFRWRQQGCLQVCTNKWNKNFSVNNKVALCNWLKEIRKRNLTVTMRKPGCLLLSRCSGPSQQQVSEMRQNRTTLDAFKFPSFYTDVWLKYIVKVIR
jgi:hypothetical protein